MQPHPNTADLAMLGLLVLCVIALATLINIFFILSCYKTMRYVPEEKRVFPRWFLWMWIIPLVGFVFGWMMLPFGVPHGLRNTLSTNPDAVRSANTLKGLGLACMILITLSVITHGMFGSITGVHHSVVSTTGSLAAAPFNIGFIVIWIIYWVKVVSFRRQYFEAART